MITVSECAAFAGLASNELVLGSVPSAKHRLLLSGYLLNLHRGPRTVRDMIVSDMRGFLDLGVTSRAADLLIVLRMFLSDFPQARLTCENDRELRVGAAGGTSRVSHDARSAVVVADEQNSGVVISLRRPGRSGGRLGRPAGVASARDNNPVAARLGSRIFCSRNDR